MIDIALVREHPEIVKATITKKHQTSKLAVLKEVIAKDKSWRELKAEVDGLRGERNKISREIGELKKAGKSAASAMKKAKDIPDEIARVEAKADALENDLRALLMQLPNVMHADVPEGKDASENKTIETIGKPASFNFEPKHHVELIENLGMADFDSSSRTSGTGFYYLMGDLALLNQALIRFALDVVIEHGFQYVETPLMLRGDVIKNVTDLHDQKNQIYKIEGDDSYLIGTSEHSLIGRYVDSILNEKQLPMRQASYSMCFRREIGSHGIDEKGLYRTHQFNKIEMVVVCTPENSMEQYEKLKAVTVEIFKKLGVPIRVLAICSGDLGDLKHIQVDVEAWSPRKKDYFEVGSCSNLTDAQARRLKIRCDGPRGRYVPHTLNNTAIATSRALVAIIENFQQKDGSIAIPKVLQPYMYGKKFLKKSD